MLPLNQIIIRIISVIYLIYPHKKCKLKQIRKDTNSDEIGVNISVDKKRIRIRSIDFRYNEDDEDNDKENIKKLPLNKVQEK